MKICVINGSPKGEDSATLQSALYIAAKNPRHSVDVVNAAARINEFEKDGASLAAALKPIAGADAVIWAFPVYYMVVPAQLKRFIELLFERKLAAGLAGKRALSISTSIHFFDHTANEYIREISEDMGMEFFGSFSAAMDDLLKPAERERLLEFWRDFEATGGFKALPSGAPQNTAAAVGPVGVEPAEKKSGERVIILDFSEGALSGAVKAFSDACPAQCEAVDAAALDIKGGCLGCIRCGYDNVCVYDDGFCRFFIEKVKPADAVVFALPVKDRFFSARFKTFLDRSFFLGHVPAMAGKTIAFLVAGDVDANPVARDFIKGYGDCSGGRLAGWVDSAQRGFGEKIQTLARLTAYFARNKHTLPPMFNSVASKKLFRDFVYLMPFVFAADYRYYKENRYFDFPCKRVGARLGALALAWLMKLPAFRRAMVAGMRGHMCGAHKKIVAAARQAV